MTLTGTVSFLHPQNLWSSQEHLSRDNILSLSQTLLWVSLGYSSFLGSGMSSIFQCSILQDSETHGGYGCRHGVNRAPY